MKESLFSTFNRNKCFFDNKQVRYHSINLYLPLVIDQMLWKLSVINQIRSKLVENAASVLKTPAKLVPVSIQQKMLLEGLKQVFHEALEDGDFEFLEDKWLKVSILDLELEWFISYQDEKLVVSNKTENDDVSFSGQLNDLILIAGRKEDPDTLFFNVA